MDDKTTPPQQERAPLFSFAHEAAPDPRDALLRKAFDQAAERQGPTGTQKGGHADGITPDLKPSPSFRPGPEEDTSWEAPLDENAALEHENEFGQELGR